MVRGIVTANRSILAIVARIVMRMIVRADFFGQLCKLRHGSPMCAGSVR